MEMKLELGAGRAPTPGFVTLDLNPATKPDIVGPAYPLPAEVIERAPWDEIRAVDVLEHISYRDTDAVLAGWARVLVPGGKLYVQVPDARRIMQWFCDDPARLVDRIPPELPQTPLMGACWRLFGGQGDGLYAHAGEGDFNLHRAMFSDLSLTAALDRAGFVIESMEVNGHPNLLAWAVKR